MGRELCILLETDSRQVVRGRLATARCRRRRLPPYRWWPLAVAGRITELGVYS